LVVLS
jgi:hypothetical protein